MKKTHPSIRVGKKPKDKDIDAPAVLYRELDLSIRFRAVPARHAILIGPKIPVQIQILHPLVHHVLPELNLKFYFLKNNFK